MPVSQDSPFGPSVDVSNDVANFLGKEIRMFRYLPSMERIAFQPSSPLASAMISLCKEYLDWVATTRVPLMVDGRVPIATDGRMKAAVDYGRKVFAPKLQALLISKLNMSVKVEIYTDRSFGCAVLPAFRSADGDEAMTNMNLYSGTAAYGNTQFDPALFDSLDSTVNLKTGKFTKIPKGYLGILMILAATYLGDEVLTGATPLTAEEHAAIIIHECGHLITTFEHAADLYHRSEVAGNSVRYLNEKADEQTILKTLDTLTTAVRQNPDTQRDAMFGATLATIKRENAATRGFVESVAAMALLYFCAVAANTFERMATAGQFGVVNTSSDKSSDTTVTLSNAGYDERVADEYASRHGLGAALASALVKAETLDTRTAVTDAIRNHITLKMMLGTLEHVLFAVFGPLLDVDDGRYDPLLLRLEHVLRNNMVVFKDDSLSDDLRNYFIRETADLLETVKRIRNSKRRQIKQLFWGTIMRILSRGSVLDGVRTAGLSADYDTLQLLTNGLVKNTLAYHAARLKSL